MSFLLPCPNCGKRSVYEFQFGGEMRSRPPVDAPREAEDERSGDRSGPLLFVYLFLIQPEYGGKLTGDQVGRGMLAVAIVCEVLGLAWIFRIMKTDY